MTRRLVALALAGAVCAVLANHAVTRAIDRMFDPEDNTG